MRKKVLLGILIGFLVMGTVFAGGQAEGQKKSQVTAWMGSWWADEVPRLKEGFEKKYPDIELTIETLPIANYIEAAITSILGGNPPDALALDSLMVPTPVGQNLLAPLDDMMKRYGYEKEDFTQAVLGAGIDNGATYALPYRTACNVLFYNKTMFDEAGVEYPTDHMSYDEVLELARKLTIPGKQYGFGIAASKNDPANVMTSFCPILWDKGGDFLNEDMTESRLDTPESIAGITFYTELYTKYKVVPEGTVNYAISADLIPMAQNGQIAMLPIDTLTATGMDAYAEKNGFEWGMCVLPGAGRAGGWMWTIPVNAKNPDGAEKFIDYFFDPEVLSDQIIVVPGLVEAQKYGAWANPIYEKFYEGEAFTKSPPATPYWTEIQNIVVTELQNALQQECTPEEAARAMSDQINALLQSKK